LSKKLTHTAPVYPAVEWGPGGLVSLGEAAHPVVTSMDTWCKLGKHASKVLQAANMFTGIPVMAEISTQCRIDFLHFTPHPAL